jgi:hypothetical protein
MVHLRQQTMTMMMIKMTRNDATTATIIQVPGKKLAEMPALSSSYHKNILLIIDTIQ